MTWNWPTTAMTLSNFSQEDDEEEVTSGGFLCLGVSGLLVGVVGIGRRLPAVGVCWWARFASVG